MNLKSCVNYLNKEMSGYSMSSVQNFCLDYPSVYKDHCVEVLSTSNYIHLKDEKDVSKSVFDRLYDEVGKCHYDNGVGLNEEEDYFDHYDRDQEFWGWFEDYNIDRFEIVDNEVHVYVDFTLNDLVKKVKEDYDGSSYEHDFGN